MHTGFVYTQEEVTRLLAGRAAEDMGWEPPDVDVRIAVIGPGTIVAIASLRGNAAAPAPASTVDQRL